MLHVIGLVPVAFRFWLYGVPTVPPLNDVMVIFGAVAVEVISHSRLRAYPGISPG
jgi:hypothetical protein